MNSLRQIKHFLEYLGGCRAEPPQAFQAVASKWWWRGLWWGALAGAILLFCGQTSKFIYIDF